MLKVKREVERVRIIKIIERLMARLEIVDQSERINILNLIKGLKNQLV